MKKLLRIEWLMARWWMLFAAGMFVFMLIGAIMNAVEEGGYLMATYSMAPYLVTNVVIIRSMITMDQDEMIRAYKLLPIPSSVIVGSKFIFSNLIFLVLTAITVTYQLILRYSFSVSTFLVNSQIGWLCISFILINFTIFGYYFLGAKNIQVVSIGGFVCVFFGTAWLGNIPANLLSYIFPLLAIALSLLFYKLSCRVLLTDVLGHISFDGIGFKKKKEGVI